MEVAVAEPAADVNGVGVVRHEEWRRRGSGGLQHTRIEATHWSAPTHNYGKVVEGVSCVGADGRSIRARRQVEVLSARAPGLLQVLKATHTHSHSHSSTTSTTFNKNFDDLQLAINPLDVSSQKERLSIGRSGMLSSRRPPSKVRPTAPPPDNGSTVSKLCHWFDADSQSQLQSPSIVANGTHKMSRLAEESSDKRSSSSENTDTNDTNNDYKTGNSEENLYDSCPEKESVFKDESDQLEEWRRASKVRRSLQYPCKAGRAGSKPLDLPDNWGSVSRIKRELENCQKNSLFSRSSKAAAFEDSTTTTTTDNSLQTNTINEANENEAELDSFDNFLIKPSILKKKTFITVDTLNEVRGKLKSMAEQDNYLMSQTQQHQDLDDGIVDTFTKPEDVSTERSSPPSVRSYVYGMEAMLSSYNQNKSNYSCGTNSLESRVSKLINGASSRSDDWHARRKSYGFEKVQSQKSTNHLLSSHEKNMESSTDSGICRSSEIVNSFGSSLSSSKTDISKPNSNRGTVITLGNTEKKESFETWLMNNRKPILGSSYQKKNEKSLDTDSKLKSCTIQSSNQISISIPLKEEDEESKKSLTHCNDTFKTNLMSESVSLTSRQSDDYSLKRHTIAVDAFKSNDFSGDMFEKKNKKVEFCKTEVHFTADSGKVNIVETDGKPPSTNNFRRRRRSSGVAPIKDTDKSNLPVTHFGDSLIEKKESEIQNGIIEEGIDSLKLNYAVITEIKSNKQIESVCDTSEPTIPTNGNCDDMSENENIRGILKNKPIKPKPYHLGEDRTILSEINQTHHLNSLERNLWGVKLKPVQDKAETPLWCSSVTLKNDIYEDNEDGAKESLVDQTEKTSLYGKIERIQKDDVFNDSSNSQYGFKSQSEHKGYSTKINFGNGDAIVETSYNHQKNNMNTSSLQGFTNVSNQMVKIEPQESNNIKQSIVVSKYLNSTPSSLKTNQINDDLKAVQKIKNVMNLEKNSDAKNDSSEERDNHVSHGSTFADHVTTPRSLMPTRGSARKLKEHELSYFGVKVTAEKKSESQKSIRKDLQTETNRNKVNSIMQARQFQETRYLKNSPSEKITKGSSHKKIDNFYESQPIYENVSTVAKKTLSDVTTKNINSGESIIDELTKAADEILQALHDYSDEDSGKMGYISDKHSQPLSTISETNTWSDRSKSSENKAVQTILGGTRKYNSLTTTKTNGKVRTSSNSSLESITKEVKTQKKKTPPIIESVEKPERPQRRKISSGDAVKARRLQRANSRDALMHVQGSSSEDISGHMEVVRKKTVRRSKNGGETTKRSESKTLIDCQSSARSLERKKESSKSSKYVSSTVPEIRHKTAVSTIMSLTDRHSASKSKSNDRSRHRERLREGTVSSLARDKLTVKEKSRSTDTSLDRENGQSKERTHRRDKSREKHKSQEDKLKRITEELGSDAEKKNKIIFDKRSPGSSSVNTSARTQRVSQPGRSSDRQATSGRVTNIRTEYDKSLRLI